jgi:endoglucanase
MFREARRLIAWGTVGVGVALLGCKQTVYLGNPLALEDHVVPDAQPVDAPPPPPDASDASYDAPEEPEPPFPWYLHASGSQILDSNDAPVHLRGINWSGLQAAGRVPDGLHKRTADAIVTQIVGLGFNLIRIPFSSQSILPSSVPTTSNDIDPVGGDPDLSGLTSLEVLDHIVDVAFRHHVRIIFDHYRFVADDTSPPSGKWYSGPDPNSPIGGFPESQWRQDWISLATRYLDKPSVVGCDLHDELATPSTWGDGNPNTDWRLAAERAGNDILAANPNLVILVQGTDVVNGQEYWPGGNLRAAGASPVILTHQEKLFYSVRDWGKSVVTSEPWFASPNFPNNMPMLWDDTWRYLVANNVAPVIVSAFGDRGDPAFAAADGAWRMALTSYLSMHQLSYAFWALNPSAEGRSGLLRPDWVTVDPTWPTILP